MKLVILALGSDLDDVHCRNHRNANVPRACCHRPLRMDGVDALVLVGVMEMHTHRIHSIVIWRKLFILIYERTTCKWIQIAHISRALFSMFSKSSFSADMPGKFTIQQINRFGNGLIRLLVIILFVRNTNCTTTLSWLQVRVRIIMFHVSCFACWTTEHIARSTRHHVIPLRIVWTLHPCDYRFYISPTTPLAWSIRNCLTSNVSTPEEPTTKLPSLALVVSLLLGLCGARTSSIVYHATHRCGANSFYFRIQ